MQIITSKDNENIKNIRKLKEKKYRDLNNKYIIEGIRILKEVIVIIATFQIQILILQLLGEHILKHAVL